MNTFKMIIYVTAVLMALFPVRTIAGVISSETIQDAVLETIEAVAYENDLDVEVSVRYPSNVEISDVDTPTIRPIPPDVTSISKRTQVKVELLDDSGEVVRCLNVVSMVKIFEFAPVATADIERGMMVSEDNIEIKKIDISSVRNWMPSSDNYFGMQAKRKMKTGTVLTANIVEPIPLIKRGDKVVIKACVGNVVVTAEGTARENGVKDSQIKVYSALTKRTISCMVESERTVLACE